ncbi:hypothetical protein DPMN_125392 [Dreissena polymorpha]|uniref:Uncharacterized protein n=1 Tax=Dreissena polymorpha TaxID=45954 RepID=A0A9D4GUC1_DREPO|nr:hypothetical protein DPMN_125392 [Dreissena polymorpha]
MPRWIPGESRQRPGSVPVASRQHPGSIPEEPRSTITPSALTGIRPRKRYGNAPV